MNDLKVEFSSSLQTLNIISPLIEQSGEPST